MGGPATVSARSTPDDGREFVALDLETTGLFAETDRIVEVGAVRFDRSGRELGRFERRVNPGRPMSPAAQAIHGLSDADLADSPRAAAVLPEFFAWLGDPLSASLLAHNAAFDAAFLSRELIRAGWPIPAWEIVDTLALARRQLPLAPNHQLDTLARLLHLDTDAPHRALADCLRVKGLWLALAGADEPRDGLTSYPIRREDDSMPVPSGWGALVEAIRFGHRVRISYAGGTRGEAPREISPRRFSHKGGVAYMVAWCHLDGFEKAFRLDRVLEYEVLEAVGIESR